MVKARDREVTQSCGTGGVAVSSTRGVTPWLGMMQCRPAGPLCPSLSSAAAAEMKGWARGTPGQSRRARAGPGCLAGAQGHRAGAGQAVLLCSGCDHGCSQPCNTRQGRALGTRQGQHRARASLREEPG